MKTLPTETMIYVGDTARVPYGTKSPDTIRRYALQISFFLLQKKVKALVVACNSVSAVALSALRGLPVPVVGVIDPGARAAVLASKRFRIGVIGTRATVSSHAYQRAIHAYAPKARVWEEACPLLVPLVEEGWMSHPVTSIVAIGYLRPLLKKKIDTLVLGCTHYPLLKPALKRIVGTSVQLIDSAEETAKDVRERLEKEGLLNPLSRKGAVHYFVTDTPQSFARLGRQFLGGGIQTAQRLMLDAI
jgi:glutamate racemase